MVYQPYTEEECKLCLEAYVAIRDSKSGWGVSNPILINLTNYLEREGISSRSINSIGLRVQNYRYYDTGTGCSGISTLAYQIWQSYRDADGEIDKDRLRADCDVIRASIHDRNNMS